MDTWPEQLQINAFSEVENRSASDPAFRRRLLSTGLALTDEMDMLAPSPPDERNHLDPRIGWGLVLADDPALDGAALARGDDAPEPLRALLKARKGVVLRYSPNRPAGTIRRYYADGSPMQDGFLIAQNFGTGRGQIPRYLLIYGSPQQIPWSFQFEVQASCYAGRIDLDGVGLARHVEALLADWTGSASRRLHSLTWSVDHGPLDITRLMRDAIAGPLVDRILTDAEFAPGALFIDGSRQPATGADLANALAEHKPRFIATTSHGATGPLSDVDRMRATLGLLVDANFQQVRPGDLQAGGSIWYAHACCSAGSMGETAFVDLVPAGSDVERILKGVAACGDMMAPLPRALLSAEKPLRAFIGHVEPTFDWSLRHPRSSQYLTLPLLRALYENLFAGVPVGMAVDGCRRMAGNLFSLAYKEEKQALAAAEGNPGTILAIKLVATDWRGMVVLGDPACKMV